MLLHEPPLYSTTPFEDSGTCHPLREDSLRNVPSIRSEPRQSFIQQMEKHVMSTFLLRHARIWLASLSLILAHSFVAAQTPDLIPAKVADSIRIASFNVSMNRSGKDRLTEDLERGDPQIKTIAAIIRAVRPDIILLNEFDYSTKLNNVLLFQQKYLNDAAIDMLGNGPHPLPHYFSAPVNTGEPSGMDLNQNGRTDDPEDAWGFGRFPGQYGMAVLSRFEIDAKASRTFQKLLWSQFANASRPIVPSSNQPYYDEATWKQLRLPSKSLWDIVINVNGKPIHLLASHPTPPAFDGPEDRNGCRNQDEIRLLVDYVSPSTGPSDKAEFWIDDQGRPGKLARQSKFVIAGDLNSDPADGDNASQAIRQLLALPIIQASITPQSEGAISAARKQAKKNAEHRGNPAFDTADFNDQVVGNLRVDYVLPSVGLRVLATGVVWPTVDENNPSSEILRSINAASDHHLVWIDVESQ
jgi:Endonuclease/Exonuclease/phosphatase family